MSTRPTRYQTKPRTIDVERNWTVGPQTPAWNALWRRITREAIIPAISKNADEPDGRPSGPAPDRLP